MCLVIKWISYRSSGQLEGLRRILAVCQDHVSRGILAVSSQDEGRAFQIIYKSIVTIIILPVTATVVAVSLIGERYLCSTDRCHFKT